MGNELSERVSGPDSFILESRDISSIAKYIKSEQCKNVFVMLGAGVSTSAGIPDFRSPETGLYANLARLNLDQPEDVFNITYFRSNPVPFYTLANEIYPGRHRPTITHSFIRLLHTHKLLGICFTQNIDTLERRAGIPQDKIVEAHGSFATQRCIDCMTPFDDEEMKRLVAQMNIPRCRNCDGLVKPDIVFFGEALPADFSRKVPKLREADLLLVMGTSLQVHPFASLTQLVPRTCPRVLINLEEAGDIGSRSDDVLCLGKCDEVIMELAKELGWAKELKKAWAETKSSIEGAGIGEGEEETESDESTDLEETEEEKLKREVEKLTKSVDDTLRIADALKQNVQDDTSTEASPALAEPTPVKL